MKALLRYSAYAMGCSLVSIGGHAQVGIQGLGHLPGGSSYSSAYAVSGDGSTIVGRSSSANGYEAFRWTAAGGMIGLGIASGSTSSVGTSVSSDGAVIVGYNSNDGGSVQQAFRWTASGGMTTLGSYPGPSTSSDARAISGDGTTVVGGNQSAAGTEAYSWNATGGFTPLGDLSGGTMLGKGYAVNADGSVVAGYGSTGSGGQAFRWTAATGMVALSGLTFAAGITPDGSMVVGQSLNPSNGYARPAYWTAAGGTTVLPLFNAASLGSVNAVSSDGSILVGGMDSKAVFWAHGGNAIPLFDFLSGQSIDLAASGWTRLDTITGISLNGTVLVGTGIRNGSLEAFVVTGFVAPIPEPAVSAILAGVAALGAAAGRRSARRDASRRGQRVTR